MERRHGAASAGVMVGMAHGDGIGAAYTGSNSALFETAGRVDNNQAAKSRHVPPSVKFELRESASDRNA